jgi:heme/copper-type cytochrome/quinol oxidase subunit 2
MRGRVFVKSEQDYENWLQEQETFSDLVAKQEKKEFSTTKLAKK